MSQHYFLAALIPARNEADRYYTKALSDERFVIGMISPQETVPAGGQTHVAATSTVTTRSSTTASEDAM